MKIPVYISDASNLPVTGLALTGGEVTTSVDGATATAAAGTVHEIGLGVYYYDTVAGDVAGRELALHVKDSGTSRPYNVTVGFPLAYDFPVGETGVARRVPAYLTDASSNPVLLAVPSGSQIQVSVDGGAFATAAGTWHESGAGNYYYDPHASEIATAGLVVLYVAATGADPYVVGVYVGGDGGPPTVDVVSPDAGEAPGSPGAFPTDYVTASETHIVIDLGDDVGLTYAAVHHTLPDGGRRCAYRRGVLQIGYRVRSYVETVGGKLRLHLLPDAGWPAGTVQLLPDLVDASGNLNAES